MTECNTVDERNEIDSGLVAAIKAHAAAVVVVAAIVVGTCIVAGVDWCLRSQRNENDHCRRLDNSWMAGFVD